MTARRGRPTTLFIEHEGKKLSVKQCADLTGMPVARIYDRVQRGLSSSAVLSHAREHETTKRFEVAGRSHTLSQWASIVGVPHDTLRRRIMRGWTVEQALSVPTPTLRRRGVVSNLAACVGTGGGSVAQERAQIEFSANPEKTTP